jgi:hypothetical protein
MLVKIGEPKRLPISVRDDMSYDYARSNLILYDTVTIRLD